MDGHFQTQNAALALTLATCGVPRPRNEKGELLPCENRYDASTLRALGYGGWELEAAVEHAWKKGIRGVVTYNFEKSDFQAQIVAAWDKKSEAIKKQDTSSKAYEVKAEEIDLPPFVIAQICCQLLKNRLRFLEEWREVRPLLVFSGPTRKEFDAESGKWTIVGSFKARTLHASAELRAHLNEKP